MSLHYATFGKITHLHLTKMIQVDKDDSTPVFFVRPASLRNTNNPCPSSSKKTGNPSSGPCLLSHCCQPPFGCKTKRGK